MNKWKKITLSFMLGLVVWGGSVAGVGGLETAKVSAAANAVPSYEVKFLADPALVLNENGTPSTDVLNTFGLGANAQAIRVEYFDTDQLDLNDEGWNVRFRKKEDKPNYELTYKKRYPILNGDVQAALTLANKEGFDSSDDNYDAEIDWGYSKQTLSFSNTKKVDTKDKGAVLPSEAKALDMLLDKLPGKLKNWSSSNWGKKRLNDSRAYGPLTFDRYEGIWNGQEMTLEVWPVRNEAGTGIEHIVEVSFKTDDLAIAAEMRQELLDELDTQGWLIPADGLKTQQILERY